MTRRASSSPFAPPLQQLNRTCVSYRGKELTYFGGCDYFRLSSHPEIISAFKEGLKRFGLNVAASRFTSGNHSLYHDLEKDLCRFFRVETATLLSSGYVTNLALAQALAGDFSHALIDSRAHQSLRDCLPFLSCVVSEFRHRSASAVEAAIRGLNKNSRILLLTDGLFSQDGSLAPLRDYLAVLPRTSKIIVDDAHGAGTIGKNGRGTVEALAVRSDQIIQTISLSKAFGVYGGAILCDANLRRKLLVSSPLLRGNTPLPLPLAHAGIRALHLLSRDRTLRQRLQQNTEHVQARLREGAFSFPQPPTPLFSITPSSKAAARQLSARLMKENIFPIQIQYGNSPSFFRFAISSEHTSEQLARLIRACQKV